MDMYGEKVAESSALIREFAKVDYFHYFARDPESSLEAFIAMQDSAHAAGRASALAELHPQWLAEKERADRAELRIAELERQLIELRAANLAADYTQPQEVSDLSAAILALESMHDSEKFGTYDMGFYACRRAAAALAASQHKAGVQVPEGWQIVPKVLTHEMGKEINLTGTFSDIALQTRYSALLDVAPPPPTTEGEQSNG